MRNHRWITAFEAGIALMAVPALAAAQIDEAPSTRQTESAYPSERMNPEPTVDLDVRAGFAFPTARLNDYTDVGLHAGVGAAWWASDYVALRVDGDLDAMPGDDGLPNVQSGMPDMNFWRLTGGLEVSTLGRTNLSPWSLDLAVGAGATLLDTPDFLDTPRLDNDVSHTYAHVVGGVSLGYAVGDNVDLSLASRGFVTFTDAHDLEPIRELSPAAEPLDHTNIIPITALVSVRFPNW